MVVPEASINNIMGGLESTGGVRLHNHKRKLKQRFDILKKLGQGTYGKVQLGINKETGQEVAIKTIKKCKIETEADLIRIRREIQIMSSVQHPNIIHIYEVFENREKMVLVMEYAAGGELYDFLSERKVLAEEEARRIFRQISTAVYYCHKHKICHRDLKLENILLDENGNAKIADFGLSNVFDESRLLGTFCGSPLYASPEIVKGTPYHGPEVDCWSLGVLLYTLVYGAMPFDGSNFKRLVRQISQGDYFEPKKPSPASPLIRDMLNVNPGRRADITAICSHWWIDAGQSEACLEVAEELANQTPVRLDLLLCLAPSGDNDKMLLADQPPIQEATDRPLRSQSLSSLATAQVQPDFLPEPASSQSRRDTESRSKRKEEGGGVKRKERSRSRRERSSSRSRRDDSTPEPDSVSEKTKRRSVKSKKSSSEGRVVEEAKEEALQPKIAEVEEDLAKSSETILAPPTPVDEVPKAKSPVPSDKVVIEEMKPEDPETSVITVPKVLKHPSPVASPIPTTPTMPTQPAASSGVIEKIEEKAPEEEEKPSKPMERRKSKIFETAEKFNKIGTAEAQPKPQPKKMVLPGVKVSDAKKAYERRSSLASSTNFIRGSSSRKSLSGESSLSPPAIEDAKFSLASSVALNKLVENVERLSKMEDENEKEKVREKSAETSLEVKVSEQNVSTSPERIIEVKREVSNNEETGKFEEETRKKVKSAVQVIGNVITEGIGETKAATLPRRRTSRAEIKLAMPSTKPAEFRSEVEHMVGSPVTVQRSEVKFPVAAPPSAPRSTARHGSAPREYIVPIQVEQDATVKPPPPPPTSQRPISRTSSKSLSRQSTQDSDLGSTASVGEPIRKSPREVIIPIAVEGGGYVTPSIDTISRMSSLNESEDDLPRGFGLHSSRRNNRQLETADSVSSDEDDDNFEILTAENLFSTLLSRVRSLTQRLNTEERPSAFPRLFNHHHSIFDMPPSRRLSEARSFGRADNVPWRRSTSREGSLLPRDGSVNTRQIGAPQRTGSLRSSGKDKPPPYRPMTVRNSSDSLRHHLNSSSTTEGTDYDTTSLDTQTDYSHQQRNINETERSEGKSIPNYNYSNRGIPTAEIIGSSVKKISRSDSRSESVKKASKLPRVSPKTVLELKGEKREEVKSPPSLDGVPDPPISQGQPRRNSLERPSFYNSLYKNGLRSYSGSMSRSVNLPSDHSLNGDPPSDTPTATGSEHLTKLDKYLSSRINNGESSMSDYDFHTVRPFSTLGRSYSMKGPAAATKSYDTLKTPKTSSVETDIEGKYSHSPSTITRVSSLKENNRLSSRFLRPKSFYGATDLTNYQGLQSSSPAESIKPSVDLHSERKSAFVSRKSPSYQRSISVFEGKKAEEYHRSLSVTPERSVLGKFLSDKKSENNTEKSSIDVNNEKPKTRKISRFLRPDFYDTPKEESVYVKKDKDKDKTSTNRQKKSSKKLQSDDVKNQENRLSIVDKAIKSLKEKSLSKNDHESMARESNLIKRAVSLEDCSLVPESRTRRSSSLTPQTYTEKKYNTEKVEKIFQKKKIEDFKKIVDNKLNTKNKELAVETPPHKEDCMIKKLARKLSPKNKVKPKPLNNTDEQPSGCNGSLNTIDSSVVEDSGVSVQDTRSRLSRIAGLKRLEFTHPLPSADSTPSIDESKLSGELDDSSSFLSPTEDCSDTWSVSSDYADAREFITPPTNEDSVSERIRRKSFYSRFNQSKRKKSSQSTQAGSRSRLPMYSKSMSSDFSNVSLSKVVRKISDPEAPVDN